MKPDMDNNNNNHNNNDVALVVRQEEEPEAGVGVVLRSSPYFNHVNLSKIHEPSSRDEKKKEYFKHLDTEVNKIH
jgi:hypothetical protein